ARRPAAVVHRCANQCECVEKLADAGFSGSSDHLARAPLRRIGTPEGPTDKGRQEPPAGTAGARRDGGYLTALLARLLAHTSNATAANSTMPLTSMTRSLGAPARDIPL